MAIDNLVSVSIYNKEMDYRKHYNLLISKAQNRIIEKGVYVEKHHIVPKSEGGSNEKHNIVSLYPREHFIAHWLLYRENPTLARSFAFNMMSCDRRKTYKPSSRAYAEGVQAAAKAQSLNNKGRKAIQEPLTGKTKLVWPYELDYYLELGYVVGRKGVGVTKGKFWCNNGIDQRLVDKLPEGYSEGRLGNRTKGKRAISKDGQVRFVDNPEEWVPKGWALGNEKYYAGWKHMKRYSKE